MIDPEGTKTHSNICEITLHFVLSVAEINEPIRLFYSNLLIPSEIIRLLKTCKCAIPSKKKDLFGLLEKSAQYEPLKAQIRKLERELRAY